MNIPLGPLNDDKERGRVAPLFQDADFVNILAVEKGHVKQIHHDRGRSKTDIESAVILCLQAITKQ